NLPIRIRDIPFKLPLDVGDEIIRPADIHVLAEPDRSRTLFRIPAKSSADRFVEGWSADFSNHASNSDEITGARRSCWLSERRTSLTNWTGSVQTPARICRWMNSSTSL